MPFTGDKTDVTALVKYARDLESETERLLVAIDEIRTIVYTPSGGQRPMDHFPKDFDRIRAIIKSVKLE